MSFSYIKKIAENPTYIKIQDTDKENITRIVSIEKNNLQEQADKNTTSSLIILTIVIIIAIFICFVLRNKIKTRNNR